jgi:acetyl-CoA carboxylase carboxyltransferase component
MLKTLAQMENGSYLRTHDLVLLFGDLPDELKDDVRGAFVEAAESKGFELDDPATHLDEVIAANRNTFVDVRYLFSRIQDSELLEVQSPFPLMDALWAVLTTYRKAHGLLTGRTVVKELEAD